MRLGFVVILAAATFVCIACDRAPSADGLKEWSAGDHDRIEDNARIAKGAQPGSQPQTAEQLIEAAWRQQCATCHGMLGKGDGPQAAMFKPSDLTSEEWQSKVSDADIAVVIKNGKNKMPKFDTMPDPVVSGLIARIRFYRGK
jgi:cytochrome c oxidase cbb3-type subunit 3